MQLFEPVQLNSEIETIGKRWRSGHSKTIAPEVVAPSFGRGNRFLIVHGRADEGAVAHDRGGRTMRDGDDALDRGHPRKLAKHTRHPFLDAQHVESAVVSGVHSGVGASPPFDQLSAGCPKA